MKSTAQHGKRISTVVFFALVVAAAMVMGVVAYSFWLMRNRDGLGAGSGVRVHKSFGPYKGNKKPRGGADSAAAAGAGGGARSAGDAAEDESEISPEEQAEFAAAIKSMKSTLLKIRGPMAQKKVDPLLAAHPNHRLQFHELHAQDRAHSVFVSVTSYLSKHCKATVRSLFDSAADDQARLRIFVGAVQVATPPPPHTTTFEPLKGVPPPPLAVEPLPEHMGDSCLGDPVLTDCPEKFFCASDNVKVRDLKKEEWRGHGWARWMSLSMYRSEAFVLFLDARANIVSHNWHATLESEWLAVSLAAASTHVVLSMRIPVHEDKHAAAAASGGAAAGAQNVTVPEGNVGPRLPLCKVSAAPAGSALPGTLEAEKTAADSSFVKTPFASAAFLFGPSRLLLETILDSTPWASESARDWHLSAALHAVGFDVYAPKSALFATEQAVEDAKKTSADTLAEAVQAQSGVVEADKLVAAVVDGRQPLPVHPHNKRVGHRKMADFEAKIKEAQSASVCHDVHA